MAGGKISKFNLKNKGQNMFAVKEAVFPFNKFPNVDVLLGPEMKSTGEVMGLDEDFGLAFAKSQIAAGNSLPIEGLAFISLKDKHKNEGIDLAKKLIELNFSLCGTPGTANIIKKNGIKCKKINKVSEGSPNIVDTLNAKKIALVINTGGGKRTSRTQDSKYLRRATLINKVPYCTNMSTAYACLKGIKSLKSKKIKVRAIQDI
jgi:carbamoyl-phosphate synthase large subunit